MRVRQCAFYWIFDAHCRLHNKRKFEHYIISSVAAFERVFASERVASSRWQERTKPTAANDMNMTDISGLGNIWSSEIKSSRSIHKFSISVLVYSRLHLVALGEGEEQIRRWFPMNTLVDLKRYASLWTKIPSNHVCACCHWIWLARTSYILIHIAD